MEIVTKITNKSTSHKYTKWNESGIEGIATKKDETEKEIRELKERLSENTQLEDNKE